MSRMKSAILCLISMVVLTCMSSQAFAGREGRMEASLLFPYLMKKDIWFDGGATAEIGNDPGFGFGFAYNFSDQLAGRIDLTWNSVGYNAQRVLDDEDKTVQTLSGRLDTFNLLFGADYYFTRGKVAPFISGNFGWTFVDSNIASGPPQGVCWWDPWFGYICEGYQPTHNETNMFVGAGIGLRVNVARRNFIKAGFYQEYMEYKNAGGSEGTNTIRVEFGISY